MANAEHVAILKRGSTAWNQWRHTNPHLHPDLIAANFAAADLRGADFSDTQLNGAYLNDADLSHSRLVRAVMVFAQLNGAVLVGANLALTNLAGARLEGADLRSAELQMTNLSFADLRGANLDSALFESTILGCTNLSEATGLQGCVHLNASILDHQTLALSGPLPAAFVRGCGLPEEWIKLASTLARTFPSCFISYASQDQRFVERLHNDLQNGGVRCWFAPKDLRIGEPIRLGIDESIRRHDRVLLVLSSQSVESPWVAKEVETALEEERKQKRVILFPIRVDDSVLGTESGWAADIRRSKNIGDFTGWKQPRHYKTALQRLFRDLRVSGTS
jgi:hypothetical protein